MKFPEEMIPLSAIVLLIQIVMFGTKGTQPFLDKVPVEYVEKAIEWLKELGYKKIGIDGMSKGSEMALVAATLFEDL